MGIPNILQKIENKNFLVAVLFSFATVFFFSRIFFGLDFSDGFFHLNQARDYLNSERVFTYFLSSVLINFFIEHITANLIYLRLFNALLIYFSILLPFFANFKLLTKRKFFFFAGCILIYLTALNANILGYDTFSVFSISVTYMVVAKYFRYSNVYLLLLISIACALSIFIRLPNICLIPIIVLVLITDGFKNFRIKQLIGLREVSIFLLTTFFILCAGYFLFLKSIGDFQSNNFEIENHSPFVLLLNYLKDAVILIIYLTVLLVFQMAYEVINSSTSKRAIKYLVLAIVGTFFMTSFILFSKYSLNFSILLCAVSIYLVIQGLRNGKLPRDLAILFILFLFVLPFGSNTGFLKSSFLIVLLPFVLTHTKLSRNQVLVLLFLLPFSILEAHQSIYEDKNVLALKETINIEKLKWIRTSDLRSDYIENINKKAEVLKQNGISVYFYGNKSHLFTYLHPNTSLKDVQFFQPINDSESLVTINESLKGKDHLALFIIDSYPDDQESIEESLFVINLKELGFTAVNQNGITFYTRVLDK